MSLRSQGVIPRLNDAPIPTLLPYSAGYGLAGGQAAPHAPGTVDVGAAAGNPLAGFDDRPALERELRDTVTGKASQGEGGSFRLRPGWPRVDQLDYVQKATTSGLLLLGLLLLFGYAIANPGGAGRLLVQGAKSRAGVK